MKQKKKWKKGRKRNWIEWKAGPKLITHNHAIKRFSIFYGVGGIHKSNQFPSFPFHFIPKKES